MDNLKEVTKRRASFTQTTKTASWFLFGVRKSHDYDRDMAQLNPVYAAAADILAVVIFMVVLLLIVRAVVD